MWNTLEWVRVFSSLMWTNYTSDARLARKQRCSLFFKFGIFLSFAEQWAAQWQKWSLDVDWLEKLVMYNNGIYKHVYTEALRQTAIIIFLSPVPGALFPAFPWTVSAVLLLICVGYAELQLCGLPLFFLTSVEHVYEQNHCVSNSSVFKGPSSWM